MVNYYHNIWVIIIQYQGLYQKILILPFIKNLDKNYIAISKYYQYQLINKKIYPNIWLKSCLCLIIKKVTAIIYIILLLIDLQRWYK